MATKLYHRSFRTAGHLTRWINTNGYEAADILTIHKEWGDGVMPWQLLLWADDQNPPPASDGYKDNGTEQVP